MELTEQRAREILIEHQIERSPDDRRTIVEIAQTIIATGSPMLKAAVEAVPIDDSSVAIAESNS